MALNLQLDVDTTKVTDVPSGTSYTPGAVTYGPNQVHKEVTTLEIDSSGVANATAATGFDNLHAAVITALTNGFFAKFDTAGATINAKATIIGIAPAFPAGQYGVTRNFKVTVVVDWEQ